MQCYLQPWPLLMPRPGISARQSTPSKNRFRKRVQSATRVPSPWVKGFSPLFNRTPLSAKIQTKNDLELCGNGVMNSLAQIEHHHVDRGRDFRRRRRSFSSHHSAESSRRLGRAWLTGHASQRSEQDLSLFCASSVSRHSRSSFRVVLRLHSFHTNRRLCTTDVVRGVIGHVLGSAMVFRLTIR